MSRRQVEALLAESGDGLDAVDRAHLGEELGALLGLVDDTAPAPSPELAALLGTGPASAAPAAAPSRLPDRRLTGPRGAVTGAVVLAVATVGATGLSAAANSLPAPLQRHAADLSRTYLPFDFPRPRADLRGDLGPAPGQADPGGAVPGGEPADDARVPLSPRHATRAPSASDPLADAPRGRTTRVLPGSVTRTEATSPRSATSPTRDRTDGSAGAPAASDDRDRGGSPGVATRSRADHGASPRPVTTTGSASSSPSSSPSASSPSSSSDPSDPSGPASSYDEAGGRPTTLGVASRGPRSAALTPPPVTDQGADQPRKQADKQAQKQADKQAQKQADEHTGGSSEKETGASRREADDAVGRTVDGAAAGLGDVAHDAAGSLGQD